MPWKTSEGTPLPPILPLNDGEEIMVFVTEIRAVVGEYEGKLVDCATFMGTKFCLNGHAVLVDKVSKELGEEPRVFLLKREGKVGRAVYYDVLAWDGDEGEITRTEEGKNRIQITEDLIQEKIAVLPPRD